MIHSLAMRLYRSAATQAEVVGQALTGLRPSPMRRAGCGLGCGLVWVKGLRPTTKRCHYVPVHGPLSAVRWPLRAESSGRSIPMTLPRSAADVLAGHVLFEVEV